MQHEQELDSNSSGNRMTKTQSTAPLTTHDKTNEPNDKNVIRKKQLRQHVATGHIMPPFLPYHVIYIFTAQHYTPRHLRPHNTPQDKTSCQAPCMLFYTVVCVQRTLFIHLQMLHTSGQGRNFFSLMTPPKNINSILYIPWGNRFGKKNNNCGS